jgi:hypothetical protein
MASFDQVNSVALQLVVRLHRIQRVMTDNAMNYRYSSDFKAALVERGAKHKLIRSHRSNLPMSGYADAARFF